jgi:hypothetical protein
MRPSVAKLSQASATTASFSRFTDAECLVIQLIDKLPRTDLDPFDEARGFHALLVKL